jgi:hypothetical protein
MAGKGMKAARTIGALVLGLVALFATLPVGQAFADPPTVETFHFNFTRQNNFWSQVCGFPVTFHLERDLRITDFTDQNGNFVREIDRVHDSGWLAAHGVTLDFNNASSFTFTLNPDGTAQLAETGLDYRVRGTQYRIAGRSLTLFDANGNYISDSFDGSNQSDPAAIDSVCAALNP